MATTHVVHRHESHGNHPMSVVAFCLLLGGIGCAGTWIVLLATGHAASLMLGLIAAVLFAGSVAAFRMVQTHSEHGPLQPENTPVEAGRYLSEYRS